MASGNEVNFFYNYILPKPKKHWDEKWQVKWQKRRAFFSGNGKYNYLNYMETGAPDEEGIYLENVQGNQPAESKKRAISYLEYMQDENKTNLRQEKSSGLFDKNGILNREQRGTYNEKLQNTKGIIFEGVITFEKDFGEKYCSTTQQAQEGMKIVFKNFLNKTQFKDRNVEWVGALHENTDHYHIHWTFYEKEPWRTSKYSDEKVYSSKGRIDISCFDYLKTSFYKFCTERSINVHDLRDKAIQKLKTVRQDFSRNGWYFKEFRELYKNLKATGGIKYALLSASQKKMIDTFSVRLIRGDKELLKSYQKTFSELSRAKGELDEYVTSRGGEKIKSKAESFREDLFERMGNHILKGCEYAHQKEIRSFSSIEKVLMKDKEVKHKRQTQSNIRRIKKGIAKASYGLFKSQGIGQPMEEAVGMIKNYKWAQLLEEEKERENEQKHKDKFNLD